MRTIPSTTSNTESVKGSEYRTPDREICLTHTSPNEDLYDVGQRNGAQRKLSQIITRTSRSGWSSGYGRRTPGERNLTFTFTYVRTIPANLRAASPPRGSASERIEGAIETGAEWFGFGRRAREQRRGIASEGAVEESSLVADLGRLR